VLAAYTRCMTGQYGVGVYAGQTGENHYTILLSYEPPISVGRNLDVSAESTNIVPTSAQKLKSYVERSSAKDGRPFSFVLSLTPEVVGQESTIDVKVGDESASLLLPPLPALKSVPPILESIKGRLVGKYQVIIGPYSGCSGPAYSKPAQLAKITTDGTNLTAYNECGTDGLIHFSVDGKKIYWNGDSFTVNITGDKVVLVDDSQNTWEKVQ
jgi:hypothetical protein